MKIKNPLYLTSTLLLIGAAIVFIKLNPSFLTKKSVPYFSKDIGKFCINDFCLNQENGKWFVLQNNKEIPADEEMVKAYTDKFKNITLKELISQNPDKFSTLGIGESKVVLDINNKKLEIGNITNDTDGTYVREDNGKEVYKINIILDKNNLPKSDYWQLRNLTKFPKSQVLKITVNFSGKTLEWNPDGKGNWKNDTQVEKLLNLERVKYINDFKYNTDNSYEFIINTDSGIDNISIGSFAIDKKTNIYWATLDKLNYFEINKSDFDLLTENLK